jgi:hypothetical protein
MEKPPVAKLLKNFPTIYGTRTTLQYRSAHWLEGLNLSIPVNAILTDIWASL